MTSNDPDVISSTDEELIDADEISRTRYRRHRLAAAGAVAAIVVAGAASVLLMRPAAPKPDAPQQVAAGGTTTLDSTPVATLTPATPAGTLDPSATVGPSTPPTATVRPTTQATTSPAVHQTPAMTTSPVPGGTGTYVPVPPGTDLSISGPSNATLTSDGTVYRGQITITVTNHGPAYSQTLMPVALPAGVIIDFNASNFVIGPCLIAGTEAPYTWRCYAPTVPAGGSASWVLHLKADYAPRATDLVLPGLSFLVLAGDGSNGYYDEPNSADNHVTMNVTLAGTASP